MYSPAEAERLLDVNRARAVLVVPEGFGREIASERTATVQVLIAGDNANTATTVMGYALSIVREAATARCRAAFRLHRHSAWSRASGTTPSFEAPCFSFPA